MSNPTKSLAALALLTALVGTTLTATTASASGYYIDNTAHVTGVAHWDVLNIRKWPASHSSKVGVAQPKAQVWVERCIVKRRASDWCKISWMHQTGWVNSKFLNIQYNSSNPGYNPK